MFRGMCNCSCQRLDVVEHSGDDGRGTDAATERAPRRRPYQSSEMRSRDAWSRHYAQALDLEKAKIGADELERLGRAVAARVPRKTQKIGKAYVARAFERAEAERALAAEGLDARTAVGRRAISPTRVERRTSRPPGVGLACPRRLV